MVTAWATVGHVATDRTVTNVRTMANEIALCIFLPFSERL
jgi:hypothetical protein